MHVSTFTEELFGLFTRVDYVDRLTKEVCVDDVTCVGVYAHLSNSRYWWNVQ